METPSKLWVAVTLLMAVFASGYYEAAKAEYGDVVINEFSDEAVDFISRNRYFDGELNLALRVRGRDLEVFGWCDLSLF